MPLTPADIHNMEFGKAPLGKRGYDEEQVDALLDEVSQEMIKLLEENNALQQRAGQISRADRPAPPADNTVAEYSALSAALDRARDACDRAEQHAREMRYQLDQAHQTRQAEAAKAPVIPADNLDRVLAMAQRTADDHLTGAQAESQSLLAEARERSVRTVSDARDSVAAIERDAERRYNESEAAWRTRQTDLLREIDELTEFAENYQAALLSSMVRQQHLLDGTPVDAR